MELGFNEANSFVKQSGAINSENSDPKRSIPDTTALALLETESSCCCCCCAFYASMVGKTESDHRDISSSSSASSSSSIAAAADTIDPKSNKMAIVSERKSTLNPDAPLFIPESFRQVEDFSPEWWDLVKTSTWFRDYWLNQQHLEEYFDGEDQQHDRDEIVDLLPDSFDLGIDDDEFPNMEALEDLVQSSCEAEELAALDNKKPLNGLEIDDAEALMKNLSLCKSSKDNRVSKFAVEPLKYREKPVQYMSPKSSSSSPRFIHQPR